MDRQELMNYIFDVYGVEPDYPFPDDGVSCVFRHADNRKWFALAMNIRRERLGLAGAGSVDILNVKCDPLLIGSLRGKPGFLPAYHMNKDKWITILLDGSAPKEDITALLAMSWQMTAVKERKRKHVPADEEI